jgi:multicomponent Na+:H+ antiporter subunit G
MAAVLDVLSWILLLAGSFFCVVGAIGLIRLPEFYARMHASGVTDTLGATLVIAGLALQAGWTLVMVKLGFILFFIYITSPTAAHALAKTAYRCGVMPVLDREEDGPSKG